MHRPIEDHLEEILSGAGLAQDHPALRHLEACEDCRATVGIMREHSALFRDFRVTQELEPHPGFYARVRGRIDAQKQVSIWNVFADSVFGRALATASLALVVMVSAYLFSSEQSAAPFAPRQMVQETYPMLPASDFPDEVFAVPASYATTEFGRGEVLMNLATYRER